MIWGQLDALPEVVKAVGGCCEVYMDGGIRSGPDVVKALCLGAKAVFMGRPTLYGLAYNVSACNIVASCKQLKRCLPSFYSVGQSEGKDEDRNHTVS